MSYPLQSDLAFETALVSDICEVINTPRSLAVYLLLKGGPSGRTSHEDEQLVALSCDSRHYDFAGDFADDYLVTEILKKSSNLALGVDPSDVAYTSWLDCHEYNRQTNARFRDIDYVDRPLWWDRYVDYLRRVLGPLGPREFADIIAACKHGPGSVANGRKGLQYAQSHKFDMHVALPSKLLPFLQDIMGENWVDYHSSSPVPCLVDWDEFFTVWKNAKTGRSCAKPANLAVYFQLGIGALIRRRLRSFGIDLLDQTFNQFLASKALDWGLCTTDLSTASELMALEPTYRALPDRWCHLIDISRAEHTLVPKQVSGLPDDRLVRQQKVCSMGNGYTFPLQTAVFISVVRAIVPHEFHGLTTAYGDDLIFPAKYATEVHAALEYLGFKVNRDKTCLAGRFFESCGTDWFDNQNVRPFFLRNEPDPYDDEDIERPGIPYSLQAANMLRAWAQRRARIDGISGCDARFTIIWEKLVRSVPFPWNLPVPPILGDSGVHVTFSEATSGYPLAPVKLRPFVGQGTTLPGHRGQDGRPLRVDGWEGFGVRHILLSPFTVDRKTHGVLLSALSSMERSDGTSYRHPVLRMVNDPLGTDVSPPSMGREPIRGLYGRPRLGWAAVSQWPDEALAWK